MPVPGAFTTVEQLMTRDVVTLPREASVAAAVQTLLRDRLGVLPILDAGSLVGAVSATDLLGQPLYRSVGDIMPADLPTVSPDAPIAEAHQLMETRGVERLVVVQDSRPVGIIARRDLVPFLAPPAATVGEPAVVGPQAEVQFRAVRPGRIVLHRAELDVVGRVATARVELAYGNHHALGKAVGRSMAEHRLTTVAEATARGLNELLPPGTGAVFRALRTLSIDGQVVLADLDLLSPTAERRVLGAAPVGADAVADVAMSVLHAVNGALEVLLMEAHRPASPVPEAAT